MDAANRLAPYEIEPLTWAEICGRYPDQYVCLIDIVHARRGDPDIVSARVVGNGATDDAAFEPIRDREKQYPRFATLAEVLTDLLKQESAPALERGLRRYVKSPLHVRHEARVDRLRRGSRAEEIFLDRETDPGQRQMARIVAERVVECRAESVE